MLDARADLDVTGAERSQVALRLRLKQFGPAERPDNRISHQALQRLGGPDGSPTARISCEAVSAGTAVDTVPVAWDAHIGGGHAGGRTAPGSPALPIAVLGELSLGRAKRVLGDKRRHRDRDPLARRLE